MRNFLLVKIRSMQEPCPLKQLFPLIKIIKPLTLIKSFMALSKVWALIIKLSYTIEKKSIIPVKDPRNRENESKGGLYIDVTNHFSFLRFSSKGKTCILNWNLCKESWRDGIVAFTYTIFYHRSCEKYQVYKGYDVPQGKTGLIGKKRLF